MNVRKDHYVLIDQLYSGNNFYILGKVTKVVPQKKSFVIYVKVFTTKAITDDPHFYTVRFKHSPCLFNEGEMDTVFCDAKSWPAYLDIKGLFMHNPEKLGIVSSFKKDVDKSYLLWENICDTR